MAISSVTTKTTITPELRQKREKWMNKHSKVIFASRVYGMGKNGVMISLHKNYADFSNFKAQQELDFGDDIESVDTMLISLEGRMVKPLYLKCLAELHEK